jgi:hypothetical protein
LHFSERECNHNPTTKLRSKSQSEQGIIIICPALNP